jgi:uncharacterized protein YbbC (DUF1343 family)
MRTVATGLDRLKAEGFRRLRGRRVGLIANQTTVDDQLHHLADLLANAPDVTLAALFGPEHGLRGAAQDMEGVTAEIDRQTGISVHSLYGPDEASLHPRPEQLDSLDVLVFDVQDLGSRYYTFAATMLYAMRAAAGQGISFIVLDRPNPIGGVAIEGPSIRVGYHSFVGAHSVPIRHGMTVGELALLYRDELRLDLDLEVVPCTGWSRAFFWRETGLPRVATSPNMPTPETALVYPGGCLVEGTNLSEGRGTTQPFELWGAPWLDPAALARAVAADDSVKLRPCSFRPLFHKHASRTCWGAQPHVIEPAAFRPVGLYLQLLAAARAQSLAQFGWRTEPYEFVRQPIAIDLLFGSSVAREAIEAGVPPAEIASAWRDEEAEFRERRAPYLVYH